jgi:hypothetical protein
MKTNVRFRLYLGSQYTEFHGNSLPKSRYTFHILAIILVTKGRHLRVLYMKTSVQCTLFRSPHMRDPGKNSYVAY